MKKILLMAMGMLVFNNVAIASPPYLLEDLLVRAKFVFTAKIVSFENGKVTLEVAEKLRGDPETEQFVLEFKDGEKPSENELYFVFSQGHDRWGKPEDIVFVGQPLMGQISYCGWIMLPIRKENDLEVVKNAGSGKFIKQGEEKAPLTLEQAKSLVKEGGFEAEANKNKSRPTFGGPTFGKEANKIETPEAARAIMQEFLGNSGKTVAQYAISIYDHPGLLKRTFVASVSEKGNFLPAPPPRFLIFENGKVVALDLEQLVIAYLKENLEVYSEQEIAESLIRLDDGYGPILISKLEDIPGYKKRPLDSDLESIVRAPWKFKDEEGNVYWICTTYTQNQGTVRRYKFVFRRGKIGNPVDVIILGCSIGDVRYSD